MHEKVSGIIGTGATPEGLADEECSAGVIVSRYKEWAKAGVIARYLFAYPAIGTCLDESQMLRAPGDD